MASRSKPCPDPDCKNGQIEIYDAYSPTPLVGKKAMCDVCRGLGIIPASTQPKEAN